MANDTVDNIAIDEDSSINSFNMSKFTDKKEQYATLNTSGKVIQGIKDADRAAGVALDIGAMGATFTGPPGQIAALGYGSQKAMRSGINVTSNKLADVAGLDSRDYKQKDVFEDSTLSGAVTDWATFVGAPVAVPARIGYNVGSAKVRQLHREYNENKKADVGTENASKGENIDVVGGATTDSRKQKIEVSIVVLCMLIIIMLLFNIRQWRKNNQGRLNMYSLMHNKAPTCRLPYR